MAKLMRKEARFLHLVKGGSVAVGLTVARELYLNGYLTERYGRYTITERGVAALAEYVKAERERASG